MYSSWTSLTLLNILFVKYELDSEYANYIKNTYPVQECSDIRYPGDIVSFRGNVGTFCSNQKITSSPALASVKMSLYSIVIERRVIPMGFFSGRQKHEPFDGL
jgi:hypothetical protein